MATMSGYTGFRAIGDFSKRYKKELIEYLDIPKKRVPSIATIRRVLMGIEHKVFMEVFEKWMHQYLKKERQQWVSIDGKAIKGTKQKEEDLKEERLPQQVW